jgi:hypothetical protein
LPPELRNTIGEMVFAQPYDIYIEQRRVLRNSKAPPVVLVGKGKHTLALTCVCRQLRAEMKSLFYSSNSFVIELEKPTNDGQKLGVPSLAMLDPVHRFLSLAPGRSVKSLTLAYGSAFSRNYQPKSSTTHSREPFSIVTTAFESARAKVFFDLHFDMHDYYYIGGGYKGHRRTDLRIDGFRPRESLINKVESLDLLGLENNHVKTSLATFVKMLNLWASWFEKAAESA